MRPVCVCVCVCTLGGRPAIYMLAICAHRATATVLAVQATAAAASTALVFNVLRMLTVSQKARSGTRVRALPDACSFLRQHVVLCDTFTRLVGFITRMRTRALRASVRVCARTSARARKQFYVICKLLNELFPAVF